MREGATTYSLIEYGHEEHVTVFEIRFHFINGLDPESENTIFRHKQAHQMASAAQVLGLVVDTSETENTFYFAPVCMKESSYFQAPNPACHRSENMRTRLRTFIIASFTKLT